MPEQRNTTGTTEHGTPAERRNTAGTPPEQRNSTGTMEHRRNNRNTAEQRSTMIEHWRNNETLKQRQ